MKSHGGSPGVGVAFGVIAALAYSATNVALRDVAKTDDPAWAFWVSAWKGLPAAAVAWILIGYRGYRGLPALPPRKSWGKLFIAALFMQFGGNFMFQWALSLGGLALTVPLVFSTLIASSAILGRMVLGESLHRRTLIAIGMLFTAIVTLSLGSGDAARTLTEDTTWVNVVMAAATACLAGIAYGTTGVVIRRTVTSNVSLSGSLVIFSTTGVLGLGLTGWLCLGTSRVLATTPQEIGSMLIGGTANAIAFFAVGASLRHIPVVRLNLINSTQTALCGIAAIVFFGEALTVWLVVGSVLTIAGLAVMESQRESANPATSRSLPTPVSPPVPVVDRLTAETFVKSCEHYKELGSTNDRALDWCKVQNLETPALVLADRQPRGRGRGENTWFSSPGSLTFSLIIDAKSLGLPPEEWPRLSLVAGLAMCETIECYVAERAARLKWPNDVMLGGKKVCGILVEVPSHSAGRVVVGVGLNVNTDFFTAPLDVRDRAASLDQFAERTLDRTDVLVTFLKRIADELTVLRDEREAFAERWQSRCWLTGRTVAVANGSQTATGVCQGIDGDGALLLRTPFTLERVISGVVTQIE